RAAADRTEAPLIASRPAIVLVIAAAVPMLALIAYVGVGAPGFPDQPFGKRLAEWRAADPQTLTPPEMAAILRDLAKQRPNDPEPLHNLALAELASGQPLEAAQALQRRRARTPRRADLWELLGEADAMAANGDIGADAQSAFQQALAIDPSSAMAHYSLGRAKIGGGDVAGGLAEWRALDASLA